MSTSTSPDPGVARERAGHFVERASRGDFEGASRDFSDAVRAALPPAKLAETWGAIEGQVGPLKAVDGVEVHAQQGMSVVLVAAKFERAELVIRLVVDPAGQVAGLFFQPKPPSTDWAPPPYADPATFDERAVVVGSQPGLPGVLSMPKSAGAGAAAVVLVHGSGPNDQDESIGGLKVFKDLAWGLATRGIAVLRYVKRTRHSPAGVVTQKEEVVDGARDAVALLRATSGVDPARIFVLGHSQGGYLAPRIAREVPGLAGLVILAGSTRPLHDSMLDQFAYFLTLDPGNQAIAAMLDATKEFKAIVEDPALAPDQKVDLPTGGSVTGAYFLDVRDYDPAATAKELSCRLLVLQGDRDYQVTERDFDRWRAALASRDDVVLKTYPKLNHLFVAGEGTPSPAEYQAPGHVEVSVLDDIAAWIRAAPAAPVRG